MTKIKYKNEMVKREYFGFVKHTKGFSEKTIKSYNDAICLWQEFTKDKDFASFSKGDAIAFKSWLKNKKKHNAYGEVSLSYCYDMLRHLRTFFEWLAQQPGYKKVNLTEVNYLRLSKEENSKVLSQKKKRIPKLEDVKKVIESIDVQTEIDQRDRALISLFLVAGIRVNAARTLPVKSFALNELILYQLPAYGVETKFSKDIVTTLVPINYQEPIQYFIDWYKYLQDEKGFVGGDPLFPATEVLNAEGDEIGFYSTEKVGKDFWKSTGSIRKISEKRCAKADVEYFHPHSLRHLLVSEISQIPLTEEEKKALSQNFGHENVGTTFGSYGYGGVPEERQIEIIRNMKFKGEDINVHGMYKENEVRKMLHMQADDLLKKFKSGGV